MHVIPVLALLMVFPGTAFAHESGIHLHTDGPSTNIAFAETIMDKDVFAPGAQFDSKPLDEAEQDMEDLTDLWTICIALVVGMVIARVAFKIIKKRLKNRN